MFQLIIDNRTAKVSPTTKVRLEIKSTLSDSELLRGNVVYPLDLPYNDVNAAIFENAEVIHVIYDYKVYAAQLLFCGKMLISGELILLGTNANGYRVTIIDKGMSTEFIDKLMTEIDIPESIMVEKPHIQLADYMTKVAKSEIITDFHLPMVYASKFYADNNPDFGEDDPYFTQDPDDDGGRGKYKNRWNVNSYRWNRPSISYPMNVYTFVPFPKLDVVLQKVFSINGIQCFGSFLNKARLEKIILNNNRALDGNFYRPIKCRMRKLSPQVLWKYNDAHPTAAYHIDFSVLNSFPSNYDTSKIFTWLGWSNDNNWQAFTAPQVPDFPNTTCEYSINLNLYLYLHHTTENSIITVEIWKYNAGQTVGYMERRTEFTPGVGNYFTYNLQYLDSINLEPNGQIYFVLRHTGLGSDSISSHGNTQVGVITHNADSYIEIKNETLEQYNAGNGIFKLNHHLPNISVGEFLNILRQTFGVVIYSNNDTCEVELSSLEDLFSSNGYVDLSNYVIPLSDGKDFNQIVSNSFVYKHEIETPSTAKWPSTEVINFRDLPKGSVGDKITVLADGMVYQYSLIENEDRFGWIPAYPLSKTVDESVKDKTAIDCLILANTSRMKKLFPTTSGEAYSEKFGNEGENPFGVLYYEGFSYDKTTPTAILYPFATAFNHNINGQQLSNTPMLESGNDSNGVRYTLPYLNASNNFEQSKCLFKIPLNIMEDVSNLLKPQRCTPSNAVRKVMLNSVKFIPLSISFIIDSTSKDVETEIIMIKNAR